MVGVFRLVLIIGSAVLLLACGDGLFASLDDPQEAELDTVAAGAFLEPQGAIPFSIAYRTDQTEPVTSMSVLIRSADGSVVQEEEYSATVLALRDIPGLFLQDLPEGVYFLEVESWRNGEMLISETRQFFITETVPEIRSLAVYPSRLTRRAQAVAIADIDYQETHRPYLRWRMGGRIILEGYHEEGTDRAVFSGANEPGVYRIQLDVFPWGPDEGVRPDLGTVVRQNGDLVVREMLSEDAGLEDADRYILRYDFAGHLEPHINRTRIDDPSIRLYNDVVLDVIDSRLGYRIGNEGAMVVPVTPFPVEPNSTVQLDLKLVRLEGEGAVLSIEVDGQAEGDFPPLTVRRDTEQRGYHLDFGPVDLLYEVPEETSVTNLRIIITHGAEDILVSFKVDDGPARIMVLEGVYAPPEYEPPEDDPSADDPPEDDPPENDLPEGDGASEDIVEGVEPDEDGTDGVDVVEPEEEREQSIDISLMRGSMQLGGDHSPSMLVAELSLRRLDDALVLAEPAEDRTQPAGE